MQRNPCDLGGTKSELGISPVPSRGGPSKWTKSEVATSPGPSQGPTSGQKCYTRSWGTVSGRKCYRNPAFSGVPIKKAESRSGYIGPAFSGANVLGGPHQRGLNQNWLHHSIFVGGQRGGRIATSPLPSPGPMSAGKCYITSSWGSPRGRKCYITPPFSGVPIKWDKMRSGYNTLAFSVAPPWL